MNVKQKTVLEVCLGELKYSLVIAPMSPLADISQALQMMSADVDARIQRAEAEKKVQEQEKVESVKSE
jgi:hypothetical protein